MPSYLRRRGNTGFFRWKWPRRLAACGFPSELIRSLKTADLRIARRRALTLFLRIEALTSSNKMPSRAEAEGLVRQWIDACVWRQEIHRAESGGFDYLEPPPEIEEMGRRDAGELDGLCCGSAAGLYAEDEKRAVARTLEGIHPTEKYQPIVASAAREIGVSADPATVTGRLFERTILRG